MPFPPSSTPGCYRVGEIVWTRLSPDVICPVQVVCVLPRNSPKLLALLYRFNLHKVNPQMPSWTQLSPSDSLRKNTGLVEKDAKLQDESPNVASTDRWVSLILASAPKTSTLAPSAYPDSLTAFSTHLSLKFPTANIARPTADAEPAALLDYYIPSPANHYIVSPLFESLHAERDREFFYRPSHSLLPYELYDAAPTGNVGLDTSVILAIFKAGTWEIPAGMMQKWWEDFKNDETSRMFNKMRRDEVDLYPDWALHDHTSVERAEYAFNVPWFRYGTQIIGEGDLVRIGVDKIEEDEHGELMGEYGVREFLQVQKLRFFGEFGIGGMDVQIFGHVYIKGINNF
jgi:hypothetical protein